MSINTSRKQCINVSSATYSGKEQSPLRFGLSAEGYPVSTILEGNDKLMWRVEIKNNKKVWVRNSVCNKITHEEPVITETSEIKIPEKEEIVEPIVIKKDVTDYSLFLSHRLKELKNENKDTTIDNKTLYNKVIEEWKKIKANSPNELKSLIEKIKQENTEKNIVIKKKTNKKDDTGDGVKIKKTKAKVIEEEKEEVKSNPKEEVKSNPNEEVKSNPKEEETKEKPKKTRTKTVNKK